MKNINKSLAVCIILVSILFITSCDVPERKSFETKLLGTWVSNSPPVGSDGNPVPSLSGTLKIEYYTITIEGYKEDWTTVLGGDAKRPFKDYPRNVSLKGYSEEGKIFIEYGGAQNSIPYTWTEAGSYPNRKKLLTFNFGGRNEILECPLDY